MLELWRVYKSGLGAGVVSGVHGERGSWCVGARVACMGKGHMGEMAMGVGHARGHMCACRILSRALREKKKNMASWETGLV